jgi:hypothetical protein
VVRWMTQLCGQLELSDSTTFLSVRILDQYLAL